MKLLDRRTLSVLPNRHRQLRLCSAIIYLARAVIVIFAFSILFAYLINPHVKFLQRHSLLFKNLKGPHILQVYLVFLILLASVFHAFAPEFHGRPGRLAREIPTFADTVASGEIADSVGRNLGWTDAQTFRLRAFLQAHRSNIENVKRTVERSTLEIAGAILVIPILAIFFLSDGEKLADQIILLVSPDDNVGELRSVAAELNDMLQRYIRAKVILGISSFLFSSTAMCGIWLVLSGCTRRDRGRPGVCSCRRMDDSGSNNRKRRGPRALSLDLDARPAQPHGAFLWTMRSHRRVMGHELEIHPLLAILTLMVGGAVGGIVGIYLSIPLVAALRVVWRQISLSKEC